MMRRAWGARIAALALLVGVLLAGCGTQQNAKTVTAPARTVTVATTDAAQGSSGSGHHAKKARPASRPASTAAGFASCDANISARVGTTTCPFAKNTFYEFYESGGKGTLRVFSPAAAVTFTTRCRHRWRDGFVVCRTPDGGVVKFPQAAVDAYTDDAAAAYARRADLGPDGSGSSSTPSYTTPSYTTPTYTTPTYTTPTYTTPDDGSSFCETHDCIPNYPNGQGDTVQCADGTYSQSGGIQGACSHHGGVG